MKIKYLKEMKEAEAKLHRSEISALRFRVPALRALDLLRMMRTRRLANEKASAGSSHNALPPSASLVNAEPKDPPTTKQVVEKYWKKCDCIPCLWNNLNEKYPVRINLVFNFSSFSCFLGVVTPL